MSKLLQRLADASRSGVYRVRTSATLEEVLPGSGFDVGRIALDGAAERDAILRRIAASLAFPDWFGGNWDALEDCLSDLSWRPQSASRVLLFERVAPGDATGVLLDVLAAAADFWRGRGKPFFALFIDPGGALALPELYRER